MVVGIGGCLEVGVTAEAGQQLGLRLGGEIQLQIEAVHQGNGRPLAGIDTAFHQLMALELRRGDREPLADRPDQVGLAVVEGQLQFAQPQHRRISRGAPRFISAARHPPRGLSG